MYTQVAIIETSNGSFIHMDPLFIEGSTIATKWEKITLKKSPHEGKYKYNDVLYGQSTNPNAICILSHCLLIGKGKTITQISSWHTCWLS